MYYVIVILFGVSHSTHSPLSSRQGMTLLQAVAWVVGYLQEDFALTVKGWAAGLALALLVCRDL